MFFSSFFCPMTVTPVQRTPQGSDGEPLSSVAAGMTLGRGGTCSVWNGGFLLFFFPLTLCFLFPLAGVGGLLIPAVISRPSSEREEGGRNWEGGKEPQDLCMSFYEFDMMCLPCLPPSPHASTVRPHPSLFARMASHVNQSQRPPYH
ncbi:hypothetical protein K456DRAFT_627160 [Colletotrichum gloeosporioides 23]|nr:hypothetical protein K456DRAFT_627160 [Colletotrichum gloeosporioides 23]